jgi:D-alanyl-D-alanine carboxypeptidase/D-alanyl-D-alanine-endopeptidase (penicillin-binding protein 4)
MRRSRQFVSVMALLMVLHALAHGKDKLASQIEKILSDPDVARGTWGIEVKSLNSGKILYARNADRYFTPASNTKLFTTSAVFALIGPEYRFHTTVETSGVVDKYGRLNGDLVLVGRGDPNLSGRTLPYYLHTERKLPPIHVLEELADQVVQKGVHYIDGDVIADDSYYVFERFGEGWTQDDLVWEWGAPVSALTVNDNVVFVSIMPADRAGEKGFVTLNPFEGYYRVDNRIMTTPQGTGPRRIYINREPGSNQLTLWGNIPLDDPGANEAISIEDPAEFAAQTFRELLERRGITIYGQTRTRHNELANLSTIRVTTTAPAGGGESSPMPRVTPPLQLGIHESQPIAQDLRVINKVSQNLHAELMLRLLGREKGTAGTIEGGLEVVRGFLTTAGVGRDEYVFFDGSGLSRENLVTPSAVVKLLSYDDLQPWGPLFEDTLPIAGVDGSLSDRFKGSDVAARVKAKTGALGHVNALSGYATTLKGERVVFSILANNHNLQSKRALDTIDQIVTAVVDDK